jgi:transposase
MTRKKKRPAPEQIVKKLRNADAMEAAGMTTAEVLQSLEVSEATLIRWRNWLELVWRTSQRYTASCSDNPCLDDGA